MNVDYASCYGEFVSLESLAELKRTQADTVLAMLRAGSSTAEVLEAIAELNVHLHRQVFGRAVATTTVNGIAAPPVPVTLVVMGSAGRGESFLNPDQDNGFILGDYPDAEHDRLDPYFIALADRFNDDLARVGFPLCHGYIMARNPVWRKTETQWRAQIERWTRRRDPVAVRFADALLDFRAIAGPRAPAERLRDQLNTAFRNDSALLCELSRDAPHRSVALGWFGHLVTKDNGKGRGCIELKEHGLLPLVASVRLWALRHAISVTGTQARLKALADQGWLAAEESGALIDAFATIGRLILLHQVKGALDGAAVDYLIDPSELSREERDQLVSALRHIASFEAETRAIFSAELY